MHRLSIILGLALVSSFAIATQKHSICYNYFLAKDKCVFGSTEHPCKEPKSHTKKACSSGAVFKHSVKHIMHTPVSSPASPSQLKRRYNTTGRTDYVDGGEGTCGNYNTDSQVGVCIWNGLTSGGEPEKAGWLNPGFTKNCGKEVYIQRQGLPHTVKYAPILDSCNFDNTTDPAYGCFQIYVTAALFDMFKPTKHELDTGALYNLTWDFNNLPGSGKPQNAPV
ncbi:hypothetical protein CROQUDRAFT_715233 [Cronartium quercuum f. sp. fusiforme G11]|uniref:Secreted protein n=1 Tax=Cronartium quercuum f. sp. fusiforme G11 TaxID=708437 RepID=A0A9P6TCR5_9BASI|nr:hypothetical protein CROQUDRAFT_715233 [Cronartium quercuum f. sp. fusiforme G11]